MVSHNQNNNTRAIRTENMMHAAFLMNCGAQLIELETEGTRFVFVLSLEVLDKKAASGRIQFMADRLQELADDLSGTETKRSLRDVLEDSVFTSIYTTFLRLSLRVRQERANSSTKLGAQKARSNQGYLSPMEDGESLTEDAF